MPQSINPNPFKRLRNLLPPPPKSAIKKLYPLFEKPVRFVPFDLQLDWNITLGAKGLMMEGDTELGLEVKNTMLSIQFLCLHANSRSI